jgi:hypothetical protein
LIVRARLWRAPPARPPRPRSQGHRHADRERQAPPQGVRPGWQLRRACFGYAATVFGVVDVPRTLVVWEGWTGDYGGFPAGRRGPLAG